MEFTMRGIVFPYRALHRQILAAAMGVAVISLYLMLMGNPTYAGEIIVASYEGVINPVAAEYLHDALALAHSTGAQALIFKLDTPGGLDTSMRLMIKEITSSPLPVILLGAPSGGRAASAEVFITLAAHVAAMAPRPNIGAAHPVAMGGSEMDNTMKEKVEAEAADVISRNPAALQLRYLQTLVEIAAEKNSTTIFPIPIDTLAPFIKGLLPK